MANAETYKTEELISFPQIAVEANWFSFLWGTFIYLFQFKSYQNY
jgi:hypothetical protein